RPCGPADVGAARWGFHRLVAPRRKGDSGAVGDDEIAPSGTIGPVRGLPVARRKVWRGRPRPDKRPPREPVPMVSPAAAERFLDAPWLADLDPASRHAVLNVLVEDRAPAGAVLLAQGESNDHISFLIEGSAVVERAYPEGRVETVAK